METLPSVSVIGMWLPQCCLTTPILFSILAGVGKNELIATDMVDYISTETLNGMVGYSPD